MSWDLSQKMGQPKNTTNWQQRAVQLGCCGLFIEPKRIIDLSAAVLDRRKEQEVEAPWTLR